MHKFDRQTLARFLPNPQAIATFERLIGDVNGMPSTIEAAQALAAQAMATAASALAMLAEAASVLEQLAAAPAAQEPGEADDLTPRAQLGTISSQNHDAVDITGGTIGLDAGTEAAPSFYLGGDRATGLFRIAANNWGVSINGVKLADFSSTAAAFTQNVSTTKQLISTIVDGTPPLAVISKTNVPNLNASSLNGATFASPGEIGSTTPGSGTFTTFGCNGKTPQLASALGAAAIDAATTQTLANNIRSALIANGIGS